jgi:hypothetical protein
MQALIRFVQLCVVSNHSTILGEELDMATLFFREMFRNEVAERVMSGIIALSIFGNIFITTFTAGKGKTSTSFAPGHSC